MTSLHERLVARIAPLLEQIRATLPNRPQLGPLPLDPVVLPLEGLDAPTLATSVERTIRRFIAAIIGQSNAAIRTLEEPDLATRWPLSAGHTLPRAGETGVLREYSANERVASALASLQRAETTRSPWPLDIAPGDIVTALMGIPNDVSATYVAYLIEENVGWLANIHVAGVPVICSPDKRVAASLHSLEQEESSPAATQRQPYTPQIVTFQSFIETTFSLPPLSVVISLERWTPLAVALVLHIERRLYEQTALGSARRALQLVRSLYGDKLDHHVRDALEREKADNRDQAHAALASATREALRSFGQSLGLNDPSNWPKTDQEALATQDDILVVDSRFAALLETFGDVGAKQAKDVRAAAAKRFADYRSGEAPTAALWEKWDTDRAVLLASVLWRAEVRKRLEEAQRKPAALVMAVAEPVAHLFSRVRRQEERDGQRALRLPNEVLAKVASSAAAIGSDTLNAIFVDRGLTLFGSIASHRLLRWQIFTAHRQALEANPDPRLIRVEGGWSTLAQDVLGMKSNQARDQVRDIVEAMHATELPLPPHGNYSRMLIREVHTARGRGKQWIKLILGLALLPDYVQELQAAMGHSLEARRATRLVPLLDVPPVIGRDNEHGPQATLSMLLVAYMRNHARELVEHGGVLLDERTLDDLARRAGVPRSMVGPLLDRWTHDGNDGPAFLKLVGRDRYTLGDTHAVQRTFIEDGGLRERDGSTAGRDGATRRRATLARKGRIKCPP